MSHVAAARTRAPLWLLVCLAAVVACAVPALPAVAPPAPPIAPMPTSTDTPVSTAIPPSPVPPTVAPAATATRTPRPTATRSATATPAATANPLNAQVFEGIWQDVKANYLYPDFNGLDWDAVHTEYAARVQAAKSDAEFYTLMNKLIESLNDDHSRYLSPDGARQEDAAAAGHAAWVGIGAVFHRQDDRGTAIVMQVMPGSPAEAGGIRAHDSILALNGVPMHDDAGVWHMVDIRGPEGTTVTLTVKSPGQPVRDITLTRARVEGPSPIEVRRLDGDIVYLMVPNYEDETIPDRLFAEMRKLGAIGGRPVKGFILDMRLNYGGLYATANRVLGLFARGTVGYVLSHGTRYSFNVTARDELGSQTLPLVVLAGPVSESLGEVSAGIMQDLGRAQVVGMPTAGNVEMLIRHDYADGSRVWLAQATFRPKYHPDVRWEGNGVTPDVRVDARWDEFTAENDPQLKAALELLAP